MTRTERRRALFEHAIRNVDAIVRAIIDELRALPSYASVSAEALHDGAAIHVRAMVSATRDRRTRPTSQEERAFAATGEIRAQQKVPVEDLLRGWRIGLQQTWHALQYAARQVGMSDTDLLGDLQALVAFADEAMICGSTGHRRSELDLARREHARRARLVHAVLLGSLSPAELRMSAELYGFDPEARYHAVRAAASGSDTLRLLENALGLSGAARCPGLLARLEHGEVAGFVTQLRDIEIPIAVGAGPSAPLNRLTRSFELATRAQSTATAFGVTGVVPFAELGIRPAIVADSQITARLNARYVEPLRQASGSATALLETTEAFLRSGMSVTKAAARLHVHPNTMRYRLGRIERAIDTRFDDPDVLCEVWWALEGARLQDDDARRPI